MTLRVKFAQKCRQLLTPIRKYLIAKRILSRAKDKAFKDYLKRTKIKTELVFTNRVRDGRRKFGFILTSGSTIVILRCGCSYVARWDNALTKAISYHLNVTTHGNMLEEPKDEMVLEPKRKPRSSDYKKYDEMTEALKITSHISKLINQQTTIIKPQRAKSIGDIRPGRI